MKRYGYLGKPSSSESLVTEDAVIRGLMKLQTFARLPATGKIDAATIKVLNKTISTCSIRKHQSVLYFLENTKQLFTTFYLEIEIRIFTNQIV